MGQSPIDHDIVYGGATIRVDVAEFRQKIDVLSHVRGCIDLHNLMEAIGFRSDRLHQEQPKVNLPSLLIAKSEFMNKGHSMRRVGLPCNRPD